MHNCNKPNKPCGLYSYTDSLLLLLCCSWWAV